MPQLNARLRYLSRLIAIFLAAAGSVSALVIACSSSDDEEIAIGQSTEAATINDSGFSDTAFASGFSNPTAMTFAPDGRLFVCQQTGQLRVIKNGQLLATPFLTVAVDSAGERGLLGVTFDPSFSSNNFVYIYYTTTSNGTHNRISRFTANGDVAQAGSEVVLVDLPALSSATNHNGGAMHFGNDGKLYVAVGENANSSNSQSMSTPLGKMLRFNANGSIPTDNPFYGSTTGLNRAIWALGLRNPFTFAVQRTTGTLFINDVGNGSQEEVNRGQAGANYGWPSTEGYTSNAAYVTPVFAYPHAGGTDGGCAITGGAFYNPVTTQFPAAYVGQYFFADYCNNWIRRMSSNGSNVSIFATGLSSPVDLATGPDGALYYLQRGGGGAVRKISYATAQAPSIASHPANATAPVGGSVTFTVSAAGSAPLSYQWQRNGSNIGGATAASYTLNNVQMSDNNAQFRAVVSNQYGNITSNPATLTVTNNTPPTANITSPAVNATYTGGMVINFSGTASDPQDGTLPASAFTWRIDFHHDTHNHPAMQDTSGITSGSWQVPTSGETSTNVWYRIHLTVRDSKGLTFETTRDVKPVVSSFTLATNPAGLQVTLDGQPFTSPYTTSSVVGIQRALGAPAPQSANGKTWAFSKWSDNGAQTHNIATPASATTYTATFIETTTQQLAISSSSSAGAFQTPPGYAHDNNTGTRYANDGNLSTASIQYVLSASANVSRVRLLMYNGNTRTYPLRISVGSKVVFTGSTTLGSSYFEASFPGTAGNTVTVTMIGLNSDGTAWFSIWETQIFSTGASSNSVCGNHIVEAGEQCDDGNVVNTDACSNTCHTPSCSDGIKNQGENAIDCGGASSCPACPVGCFDGIKNNGETGVDCGGTCAASCIIILSAGSTTAAGTVGPPTRSGNVEIGPTYTIIKVPDGKLCWSGINMSGKTKATVRYSNGEGPDKVTLTYNDPTVLFAGATVANAGAWAGDSADLIVTFPALSGIGTFCIQGGTGANGFIASIKQIKLE